MTESHSELTNELSSYEHPGFSRQDFSGPVYDFIERELSSYPEYRDLRAGVSTISDYLEFLDRSSKEQSLTRLTENQRNLVARFPRSEEAFVDQALDSLYKAGCIASVTYPKDEFIRFRQRVQSTFRHCGYMTFIFPEEERLVFALAHILRPQNALFLGSYYGYWGIWMLPAVRKSGGRATFLDPNPRTNEVARINITTLGFDDNAEVFEAEGTQFLAQRPAARPFDFVLLDAEGPENSPNPHFRGKRVYFPLLASVLTHLSEHAAVITHNILLRNSFPSRYFETLTQKNADELSEFMALAQKHFASMQIIDSTEGVGVFTMQGVY